MELKEFREKCQDCKAIHNLLKSMKIVLLDDNIKYPHAVIILGFPMRIFDSKEDLKYRIKMLEDLLLLEVKEVK